MLMTETDKALANWSRKVEDDEGNCYWTIVDDNDMLLRLLKETKLVSKHPSAREVVKALDNGAEWILSESKMHGLNIFFQGK